MKCYRIAALLLLLLPQINLLFAQTADQTEGCAAFTVAFTAPAGQTSFFWEFGDAITSMEENPSHIYAATGSFDVIFRNSAGGPQVGQTITINVYEKPTIELTADPAGGCAPLNTTLTANITANPAINIFSYTWDFGDTQSETGGALETVTHSYTNPGNFDVSHGITTNFSTCNTLEQALDLVSASGPPGVGFITNPNPPVSCAAPLEVTFVNVSLDQTLDWMWDFGNGNTSTELNPPAQNYNSEGNFTVTLIGTDANTCQGTASQVISIGEPLAAFMPSQDTVCEGALPIPMINNSSDGTYAWTFDNGAFPPTSTQASPLVQFNGAGITNITLTVTSPDGQCSSMTTGTVFVDNPDATFESIPTYSCTKTLDAQFVPVNTMAAQYIWSFQGGGTSDEMSPSFTYENMDTTTHGINGLNEFTTTLTVVSNAGCTASFSVVDTVHQPNALFYPDITEGCAPLEVNFENRSTNDFDFVEFVWDFGEGNTVTVNDTAAQSYTYNTPGEYEVVLIATDELGCMDTSFVQIIQVGGALNPSFTLAQTTICPGDSITISDMTNSDLIDAWHFATDANRSFHCYQEDVLTHVFDSETGVFDVTLVVEYNGCYSEVTQEDAITVNGPIAHIDYLVDCADPFNISFRDSSDDATLVAWDFGDMQISSNPDPMHMYADTGDYQVVLAATSQGSGCPVSFDTMTVHVRDIMADFDLDSLLCLGLPYDLDGSGSVNVDADCHTGYTWYFSDPNDRPVTTQEAVVEHIFEQRGTNFVTLITDDINGCRDTIIDTVRVFGVFPELIGTPTPICIPGTVSFSSMGTTADTTIENYMWDFGDGNMSEDLNPTHTYTTPPPNGTSFAVTLNVEDVIPCSGLGQFEVPVYVPTSTITAAPKVDICVGETIDFSASDFTTQGSNLTWTWSFGSGASPTTSTNQMETVTYNVAGDYQVILNYEEVGSGCLGVPDTILVSVQDFPTSSFTSNLGSDLCAPQILTFTDQSTSNFPLTINWDLAGDPGSGMEVTNTFNRGEHTITQFISTSNGCADTSMFSFTLEGPEGTLAVMPTTVCYGDEITFTLTDTLDVGTYTIDFGDGTIVTDMSPVTHVYDNPFPGDSTIVQLLLEDASGECQVTNNITVNFVPIDVAFAPAFETGCVDQPINFGAVSTNATAFNWDFGDGNTSNLQNATHTYVETGVFVVTLEVVNAIDCAFFISDTITIEEVPNITVNDQFNCFDTTVELVAEGPDDVSYSWAPAQFVTDPTSASTTTNVTAAELPSQNFEFLVTASSNTSGCSVEEPVIVTTVPGLTFPDDYNPNVCPGQDLVIPLVNPGGFYTYSWSGLPEGQTACENCDNPVISIPLDTEQDSFIVTLTPSVSGLTGGAGSCNDQIQFTINLLTNNIPNAFTPDGDNLNDFFNIDVSEFYDIRTFQIFNRWGQKIYDNDTPATGWDGTFNGNPAASEVYIFNFETTNDECNFKGNVSLIR